MIKQITVKNYKIVQDQALNITNLNLLTGINSTGKSSFIQALLLLRQSYEQSYLSGRTKRIYLGEEGRSFLVRPGNVADVFNWNAQKNDSIAFHITDQQGAEYGFKSKKYILNDADNLAFAGTFTSPANISDTPLFNDRFQYLGANRIEPQERYPVFVTNTQKDLGTDGRFALAYLEAYGQEDIAIDALRHRDSKSKTLKEQVAKWLNLISADIDLSVKKIGNSHIELNYSYFNDQHVPTFNIKPQNIGFGVAYALPIVVALLAAKPGDLILIENPETHLHPYGQAKLAELMALAAQNGVQLLIETHSDHIVNGTLVACKRFEKDNTKGIDKRNVSIYYFERTGINSRVTQISVLAGGKIDVEPNGFFDQIKSDLEIIMGF